MIVPTLLGTLLLSIIILASLKGWTYSFTKGLDMVWDKLLWVDYLVASLLGGQIGIELVFAVLIVRELVLDKGLVLNVQIGRKLVLGVQLGRN